MSNIPYSEIEENARALLNNLQQQGGPPIYTLSPDQARGVLSELQASSLVQKLPADVENRTIPGGSNSKDVSITIVRPQNSSTDTLPVVVFTH